jgi:hypothetical protein
LNSPSPRNSLSLTSFVRSLPRLIFKRMPGPPLETNLMSLTCKVRLNDHVGDGRLDRGREVRAIIGRLNSSSLRMKNVRYIPLNGWW